MDRNLSTDPRSIRARHAFHEALKGLLQEKSFRKVTVTDISNRAGLSRHTFYNHYETKHELLNSLIDSILDEFFAKILELDVADRDPLGGSSMIGTKFFEVWLENAEMIDILRSVDMERLLLDRLKALFENVFFRMQQTGNASVNPELGQYVISFSAYSVAGILVQWIMDDMRYPPEVMGDLLNSLAEIRSRVATVERFNEVIR